MNFSETKIGAILAKKCPRCRKGDMFRYPDWQINKFSDMHEECPVCKQQLYPEPGFYIGAMYISYAINVAIVITFFTAVMVLFGRPSLPILLATVLLPVFILFPFVFRFSRSLMLHFFGGIDYEGDE
jgi:uncharacterized protein (DUF983 family)